MGLNSLSLHPILVQYTASYWDFVAMTFGVESQSFVVLPFMEYVLNYVPLGYNGPT